jgi:2-polyprenyl-6-hydroxyphenyl methylase/3-demethylubiquinone-9 3-methyltransferase
LVRECARHGVDLRLIGLRPSAPATVAWLIRRRDLSRMVRTRTTAVLFQGVGTKRKEIAA